VGEASTNPNPKQLVACAYGCETKLQNKRCYYYTIIKDDNGCPQLYIVVNSLYLIEVIFMSFSYSYTADEDRGMVVGAQGTTMSGSR